MENIVTEFLTSLVRSSPVIGLLICAIIYFYRENKLIKKENKELTNYITEEFKKNIQVLTTVSNTLEKVIDNNDNVFNKIKDFIELMFWKNKNN